MKQLRIVITKHKTLFRYLIAGGLTTLVNFVLCFLIMYMMGAELSLQSIFSAKSENPAIFNVANAIAVIGAVIFAYFINKLMVFQTKCEDTRALRREMLAFFASRGLTMLLEIGAGAFLVTILGVPEFVSKLAVTVVVILLNYLLSVTVVFRKKEKTKE